MIFSPNYKKLHISDLARRDLKLIGKYTLRKWGAVQKKKYLGQMKNCFKLICENSAIGRPRDEVDEGLMSHVVQKHIVFYRTTNNELFVVRVLHQSMDVDSYFGVTSTL